jgi:hypothetical protein
VVVTASLVIVVALVALATPARAGNDVGRQLISAILGYDLVPEGEPLRASGPINADDLASLGAFNRDEIARVGGFEGYMRVFRRGALGTAVVIGIRGPQVRRAFRHGFENGTTRTNVSLSPATPLFPGETGPLATVDYYAARGLRGRDGSSAIVASGDLVVLVTVDDRGGDVDVLRRIVREQNALTPLEDPDASERTGRGGVASRAATAAAVLVLFLVPAGIAVVLVHRNRSRPVAGESGQPRSSPPPG